MPDDGAGRYVLSVAVVHSIRAGARMSRAVLATSELLGKLKIDAIFAGGVARSAWLGEEVTGGSIEAIVLMNGPQKNQLAMMASNRGFRVEREEIEQCEELDLVPLHFDDPEGEVRVHVLLASNALYGRMVSEGVETALEGHSLKVPAAEDLALMLLVGEDADGVRRLLAVDRFDRAAFRQKLISIGLRGEVVDE